MNVISPARAAAFRVLEKVNAGRGHSDDLLHSLFVNALSLEDRNLTTALVMGVLRWQMSLDAVIRTLLTRPFQEIDPPVLLTLRLGVFQLLLMDRIPPHAALNESVEMARANGAAHAAGMVNAVLRNVQRQSASFAKMLTAESAHPQWLLQRWQQSFGKDKTSKIAVADQSEASNAQIFTAQDAPQMDAGSRLIAELTAASSAEPKRILDCCAAPGGKTMVLAARHPNAKIVAADVSEKRLRSMEKRLAAAGVANVECVMADMAVPQKSGVFAEPFDLILCDAPCSGTGTLARNPEIRHLLRSEEFARQAERQRAILLSAMTLLAPSGRLMYSTCSLEPEENEDVVHAAMKRSDGLRQVDIAPLLSRVALEDPAFFRETAVQGTTLRTLPGVHATDGFFAALIEKR